MKNKVLDLPLKGKWYEMTESGLKKEEYREIKPYWIKRMFERKMPRGIIYRSVTQFDADLYTKYIDILKKRCDDGELRFRYAHVRIRYGYTKRSLQREVESVRIGIGNPEWGAPDHEVIIIKYKD